MTCSAFPGHVVLSPQACYRAAAQAEMEVKLTCKWKVPALPRALLTPTDDWESTTIQPMIKLGEGRD